MGRRVVGALVAALLALTFAPLPVLPVAADGNEAPGHPVASRSITSGRGHSCAILADGGVKCWGDNILGALGLGDLDDRGDGPGEMGADLPRVDLGAGRTATAISAGDHGVCAIIDNGLVQCWGENSQGQLGFGGTAHRGDDPGEMGDVLPYAVLGTNYQAVALASGSQHNCVILSGGAVKCWGWNSFGQLGLGISDPRRGDDVADMGDNLTTVDLGTGRTATAVTAGEAHTCALLDDGSVKCWGRGRQGRLGLGDLVDRGDDPGEMGDDLLTVDLGTGRTATAITGGLEFTCALLDDGSVKCWGANDEGQLGLGDKADRGDSPGEMGDALPPVDLGTGRTAVGISAGFRQACAVLDDGSVKCWGHNNAGQLGLGDKDNRGDGPGEMGEALPPVDLGTGRTAISATAGAVSGCAALDDGSVKCWGFNHAGELGLGDTQTRGDGPGEMGDALPPVDLLGADLSVELSAEEAEVVAQQPIHYGVTITNTGVADLSGVEVIAPGLPACAGAVADLAVGEDATVECSHTPLFADVGTFSRSVTADSVETAPPVESNTVAVEVTADPSVEVSLSADETTVTAGDSIHYHVAIETTGALSLNGVTVTAGVPDCLGPVSAIPVGVTTTVDCEYAPVISDADTFTTTATVDSTETAAVATNAVDVDVVAPPHGFDDVPPGVWYEGGLDWVTASELVDGFPDGTYRPKSRLNRAQTVSILWRLVGGPTGAPPHPFTDVPDDAWYGEALDWAADVGVVAGFAGSTYAPKEPVNRAQIVAMLWNLVGRPGGSPPSSFTDVPPGRWYGEALDWAVARGLVAGFPDGTYRPKDALNRGQAANIVFALAGSEQAWVDWAGDDLSTWRFA